MLASLFDWRGVSIENQATSEVIKDKHKQTTACEYAEKAIRIVDKRRSDFCRILIYRILLQQTELFR